MAKKKIIKILLNFLHSAVSNFMLISRNMYLLFRDTATTAGLIVRKLLIMYLEV